MAIIKEIKFEQRNTKALQLLEVVTDKIKESPNTTELLVLAKIDGDYYFYTTDTKDAMQLVATLELAKFDVLQCMMD